MQNRNQKLNVTNLSLLLGVIVSCGTASCIKVILYPDATSAGALVPEETAYLYCPHDDNPMHFVDALMAGTILPTKLTPCLPLDINASLRNNLEKPESDEAIRQLDAFGWQTFIALNWPVEQHGDNLRLAPSLAGPGEPRWYTWNTTDEVFTKGAPLKWHSISDQTFEYSLRISEKNPEQRIWDQHGRPVQFEIMMNRTAYENIMDNELYTAEGQSKTIGTNLFGWGKADNGTWGATVIKLAWKQLDEQDQAGRFFRRTVKAQSGGAKPRLFGLVGMHIAYKVSFLGDWVWSTFEHIDNVDDKDEPTCAAPAPQPLAQPLFYDKECEPEVCPENDPASKNPKQGPDGWATQIVRKVPIRGETAAFNCKVRALLHKSAPQSPAQYYKLVAAQAAVSVEEGKEQYVPSFAMNTVLETYEQTSGGGCAQCHRKAPIKRKHEGAYVDVEFKGDSMFMLTRRLRQ
ncbi:hypothetical protein [Sorangium sp. So ce406]|uniref:hypothetical protein n=1 Tax=Sorangium sp. So ce406 TaxID=3133311 RepID=UPI003F5CB0AA